MRANSPSRLPRIAVNSQKCPQPSCVTLTAERFGLRHVFGVMVSVRTSHLNDESIVLTPQMREGSTDRGNGRNRSNAAWPQFIPNRASETPYLKEHEHPREQRAELPLRATAISGAAQGQASAPSPVPAYREKRRRGERRGRQIRAPLARRLRPSSRARSLRTVRRSKSPIGSTPTVSSSRRRASNGEQRGSNVALLLLTPAARRGSVPASPMKR